MTCKNCDNDLQGRVDKIFCDAYCKSNYHYKVNRDSDSKFYKMVNDQLKLNRRLLKSYNREGKTIIRIEVLLSKGFNPKYFTHYWKNSKGDIYLFVYEFGFLKRNENGTKKYILVTFQDYMN
jgi:hypothetical protein